MDDPVGLQHGAGFWILKINDYLSDLRQHKDAENQPAEDGCLGIARKLMQPCWTTGER